MYKVFVNDKPIILTSEKILDKEAKCIPLKKADVEKIVKKISSHKWDMVYLYHPDEEKLLKKIKLKLPVVVAAGGLVRNGNDEVLFIKRNGKWDLPKGRVEGEETLEEAAVRETEEETGVRALEIVRPLSVTYHIFNRNNKMKLKVTHWFEMKTSYSGLLIPQENEGIKKVKWKDGRGIKKALRNSYANIWELFAEA